MTAKSPLAPPVPYPRCGRCDNSTAGEQKRLNEVSHVRDSAPQRFRPGRAVAVDVGNRTERCPTARPRANESAAFLRLLCPRTGRSPVRFGYRDTLLDVDNLVALAKGLASWH